jgi:murein DD-endopeptidase MepM/ murein hydrolase activator NlpD
MGALSRLALVGIIGGGVAACSSDASRLGDPFTNPFAASEPSATGSLPDQAELPRTAPLRTGQIQSESLPAPTARMSPRPSASPSPANASPAMTSRVASTEPSIGTASGMNPDAGKSFGARPVPAPAPALMTPSPKAVEKRAAEAARKEAEAKKLADARKLVEANKQAEARKAAEAKKLIEEKKLAEAKAQEAEAAKRRVRPGQSAKAEDKAPKAADTKVADVKKAEVKKAEVKVEAKPDPAKAKAEAARKAAEAEAKTAKAEAAKQVAKEAASKAAEAKAQKDAEAAAKAAAPVKVAAAPAPEKVEPASTGSVDQSFRWPAKGRVIAGYGSSGNEGINIAVPEGTPVKAAEDGTVAYAGSDVKGYGKLVLVRHNNGYVSAYAHNAELDVRPGEKVKRGQTIAKSGASGNVTSPQLHFEIRKGATPVDPMPHLASN